MPVVVVETNSNSPFYPATKMVPSGEAMLLLVRRIGEGTCWQAGPSRIESLSGFPKSGGTSPRGRGCTLSV